MSMPVAILAESLVQQIPERFSLENRRTIASIMANAFSKGGNLWSYGMLGNAACEIVRNNGLCTCSVKNLLGVEAISVALNNDLADAINAAKDKLA